LSGFHRKGIHQVLAPKNQIRYNILFPNLAGLKSEKTENWNRILTLAALADGLLIQATLTE